MEFWEGLLVGNAVVLRGRAGSGKTTILQRVHATAGGILLGARQFIDSLAARHPDAIEEAFLAMIEDALAGHDLVIVDDLHLVTQTVEACNYPRACLLDAALTAMLGDAAAFRKKLLFGLDGDAPWPIRRRAYLWTIAEFGAEDDECVCRPLLAPEVAGWID